MSYSIPGVILWKGPSLLDGRPIVLIATFESKNRATGPMIQTWILRSDINPLRASATGEDVSICGNCPLRGSVVGRGGGRRNVGRGCYVILKNAPLSIYRAFKRGSYPIYDPSVHRKLFDGRRQRDGSYGDPVSVPMRAWLPIFRVIEGRVGYTSQWRNGRWWRWRRYLMASVQSVSDARVAQSMGWRTYRVRRSGDAVMPGEIICPKSAEAGHRQLCYSCQLCNGHKAGRRRPNVVIIGHGSRSMLAGVNRVVSQLEEE